LTGKGRYAIGDGGAKILEAVNHQGSITKAAEEAGVSYKYAWDQLANIEKAAGQPILKTKKGGVKGGGAELTDAGRTLLKEYQRLKRYVGDSLKEPERWEDIGLKISARNRLSGKVKEVVKGTVTASIKIDVEPSRLTAVITKEAAEDLDLKPGDKVYAIIKATEIMVSK
jgi:molybdate transport system regulatory protein